MLEGLADGLTVGCGFTVTGNEQVYTVPQRSVAMQLTVVVPTGKVEPDEGLQVKPDERHPLVPASEPSGSVRVGELKVTTAPAAEVAHTGDTVGFLQVSGV